MPESFANDDEVKDLLDSQQSLQRRRRNHSIGQDVVRLTDMSHHLQSPRDHGVFHGLENPFRNESNRGRNIFCTTSRAVTRSLSPRRKRPPPTRRIEPTKFFIYVLVAIITTFLGVLFKSRLTRKAHGVRGPWTSTRYDPSLHVQSGGLVSTPMILAVKSAIEWRRQQLHELNSLSQERSKTRRERTRPPPLNSDPSTIITQLQLSMTPTDRFNIQDSHVKKKFDSVSSDICGAHAKNASRIYPQLFPKHGVLNKDSMVLITGILSPLGFHLAMKLALQCKVQVIISIDPIYPNTYRNILRSQQTIAFFTKHIPQLQLPVTVNFVGLDRRRNEHEPDLKIFLNTTGEINLVSSKITHVLHLASSDPFLYRDFTDEKYKERYESRHSYVADDRLLGHLFGFRQSLVGMEQVLMGLSANTNRQNIHYTFVSTMSTVNEEDDPRRAEEQGFFDTAKLVDEIMARTFSKLKQVSSVAVRVPMVYGPVGRQGSLMYELAEQASRHWADLTHLNHSNSNQSCLLDMIGYKGNADQNRKDLLFVDGKQSTIIIMHENANFFE